MNERSTSRACERSSSRWGRRSAGTGAVTRAVIIEATIQCLVECGHSRTTLAKISHRAGLSRGSLLHHFASRAAIMRTTIEYLLDKRFDAFQARMRRRSSLSADVEQELQAGLWCGSRQWYVAFFELRMAARTQPELAEVLWPLERHFEAECVRCAQDVFPAWQGRTKELAIAMSMLCLMMAGCALGLGGRADGTRRMWLGGSVAERPAADRSGQP